MSHEGILLVNKSANKTSFSIIHALRKITKIKKIGHTGTLDPFATGLMVLLIGSKYTKKSQEFLFDDKEYIAELCLGYKTNTFDRDGKLEEISKKEPFLHEIDEAVSSFQGQIEQIPPMFSAKKVNGQKLYKLARKGTVIERKAISVHVQIQFLVYVYPTLKLQITCSKGTYIRTLANDIGEKLTCGAYLKNLERIRVGKFHLRDALNQDILDKVNLTSFLCK